MASSRRVYTPEFKLQAVRLITEQKLSVAEVARRPGVTASRPHDREKAVATTGTGAFPGSGHLAPVAGNSAASAPRPSDGRWSGTS